MNENKIDEVAILTSELGTLRRDFKDMLFTSLVDLEERIDRRILRVIQEIRMEETRRKGKASFKRPAIEKMISQLPKDAIVSSIKAGERHIHTPHEEEQVERLNRHHHTSFDGLDLTLSHRLNNLEY